MSRRSDRQFITEQAQAAWNGMADGDMGAWNKGRRIAAAEGPGTPDENRKAFEKAMDADWNRRGDEIQAREAKRKQGGQ